ncbi:MAG: IclR family transcriptional regulator [Paracoccaceae bacterium]
MATDEATAEAGGDRLAIASVRKAMVVLETVAMHSEPIGLTRIAEATGFGKSAVQRLTHTLGALGYLEKDPSTRRYRLTVRMLDLTYGFLSKDPLITSGMLQLIDARERIGETLNMGRLEGTDFIYTVRMPAHRLSIIGALIGRRQPAFCTSGGRAVLSRMPRMAAEALIDARPLQALTPNTTIDRGRLIELIEQARIEGFSATDQEVMMGELAVSAPITDEYGQPIGAVQCSVSTAAWTFERMRAELAPQVMETARLISRTPPSRRG